MAAYCLQQDTPYDYALALLLARAIEGAHTYTLFHSIQTNLALTTSFLPKAATNQSPWLPCLSLQQQSHSLHHDSLKIYKLWASYFLECSYH